MILCRDCRYWSKRDRPRGHVLDSGECRRHQPSPRTTENGHDYREWPITHEDDWCGDAEPVRKAR